MIDRKRAKRAIKPNARSAGSLDVHFGEKLRAQRLMTKMSQDDLAKALGLTFQQIQKYEKGANRMSAATMVRIAAVLEVDVQYFFDELPTGVKNNQDASLGRDVTCSARPSPDRRIPQSEKRQDARRDCRSRTGACSIGLTGRTDTSPCAPRWRGLCRKPHCLTTTPSDRTTTPRWRSSACFAPDAASIIWACAISCRQIQSPSAWQ
jgi:transcriptional regulator with XRE-family HTH domain